MIFSRSMGSAAPGLVVARVCPLLKDSSLIVEPCQEMFDGWQQYLTQDHCFSFPFLVACFSNCSLHSPPLLLPSPTVECRDPWAEAHKERNPRRLRRLRDPLLLPSPTVE